MIRKLFLFVLYALFALSVTALFIVVLFPRERISDWAAAAIESRLTGFDCSVGDIRYVHPLKIRLYTISLVNDFQKIDIPIDTLLLSFQPTWPVEQVAVSGVAFGGSFEGDVQLDDAGGRNMVAIENLKVSRVRLGEIAMITEGVGRPLDGMLSFSGRASLKPGRLDTLRLAGDLRVRNFTAPLRRPVFAQTRIELDDITARVSLSSSILQLTEGRASGRLVHGDFAGTVRTAALWRNRELDITGNAVVQPALLEAVPELAEPFEIYVRRFNTRAIPYTLSGTLSDPQIDFADAAGLESVRTD